MSTVAVSPSVQEVTSLMLVDLVLPDQSNHHGTLFGGAALSMLDKLAFILASKALRRSIVTAAISQIDFQAPAHAGYLTETIGTIVRQGRRSVTIDAELVSEDLTSGERTSCLTGQFVMVATGEEPGPAYRFETQVPELAPDSVCVAEIVFPQHANHRGILHGGPAMDWIATAGFAAATRSARLPLVMASTERLDFLAPARVGDIVEIVARPVARGRSSLTVECAMTAETPDTGERRLCTRASSVFVAIDEEGRPVPLAGNATFRE